MKRYKLLSFAKLAQSLATLFSKDPSTQVGGYFIDDDYTVITQGYNGFPRGVAETPERWERPAKYLRTEHAERNGIFNLARSYLKGGIALCTAPLAISDFRALASIGVSEVYAPLHDATTHPQEASEDIVGISMLQESQIAFFNTKDMLWTQRQDRQAIKIKQHIQHAIAGTAIFDKDPHAGQALILDANDYSVLTSGYSGMPRGAQDFPSRFLGESRFVWVESAIRNAIFNKVRPILKGTTLVVTHTPCVECARASASVGVKRIVYIQPSEDMISRWGKSFEDAITLIRELGIEIITLNADELYPVIEP